MRKQTKLVAALSATALLAIGASAVSFAAGWNNTTGTWQYLDNEGNPVADVWKKSGDYWFYLGSDGNMVTNEVVQNNNDYYYVNQDGAMVTNQWVAFDVDSSDTGADHRWMYFGADGKAYRDSNDKITISDIKTINGKKYLFDQEGYMLYGWLGEDSVLKTDDSAWQDADYYYGGFDDGSAQHGWVQLTVQDTDGNDTTAWFYFDDNGKMTKNGKKTVNGKTYFFRPDGRMIEDWSNARKNGASPAEMLPADSSSSNIVYVNGDGGARKNQWIWAVPSEKLDEGDYFDDNYSWWWADNSGKVVKNTVKRIKSKFYAFDKLGRMLSGLQVSSNGRTGFKAESHAGTKIGDMELGDYLGATFDGDIYYFSSDYEKDGSRKTGYQKVSFADDDYQMYFLNNGKAANNFQSKIKKYVNKGVVLAADNDTSNYGYIAVNSSNKNELAGNATVVEYANGNTLPSGTNVLVNAAGTVQKNKFNLRDANDVYYVTDKDGVIVYASYKKLYNVGGANTEHPVPVSIPRNGNTITYYTE